MSERMTVEDCFCNKPNSLTKQTAAIMPLCHFHMSCDSRQKGLYSICHANKKIPLFDFILDGDL